MMFECTLNNRAYLYLFSRIAASTPIYIDYLDIGKSLDCLCPPPDL
jgi:hypothetical protein